MEKKITPYQFTKISREELEKKNEQFPQNNPSQNILTDQKSLKPRTAKDLIYKMGDKEVLETLEEKFEVIDYVFQKSDNPIIICHSCGGDIKTNFFTSHTKSKDIIFCPGCYLNLPKCDNCGTPTKQSGIKLPTTYCSECRSKKTCDCCNKSISPRENNRITNIKGVYCTECYNFANRCIICSTPTHPTNDVIHIAGKPVCKTCYMRKITLDEARKLNLEVTQFLNKHFNIKKSYQCSIQFASFSALNPSEYDIRLGRFLKMSDKHFLALYEGITRERAIGILAMEYSKQILHLLNPKITDQNIIESFSIWGKSFVLKEFGEIDELLELQTKVSRYPLLKVLWNIERLGGITRIAEKIIKGDLTNK